MRLSGAYLITILRSICPMAALSQVLWKMRRGAGSPLPSPARRDGFGGCDNGWLVRGPLPPPPPVRVVALLPAGQGLGDGRALDKQGTEVWPDLAILERCAGYARPEDPLLELSLQDPEATPRIS
jgi:hypothetical protein